MTNEPEIDADTIVTTMGETEIVNLIMEIDSLIGDTNFTQFLLKNLIGSMLIDMSRAEIVSVLIALLEED